MGDRPGAAVSRRTDAVRRAARPGSRRTVAADRLPQPRVRRSGSLRHHRSGAGRTARRRFAAGWIMTSSTPDREWWRDAVMYQVYLRSFADGNEDGVGDLAGLRA